MNRNYHLLWTALLALGLSTAWAQSEVVETQELPEPAADEALAAAADGLATASEATMRLMEDDGDEVTNEVELPELPEAAAFGQSVADRAMNGDIDGREIASDAQEAAESRGRAEDLPVDVPGRPENVPAGPPNGT